MTSKKLASSKNSRINSYYDIFSGIPKIGRILHKADCCILGNQFLKQRVDVFLFNLILNMYNYLQISGNCSSNFMIVNYEAYMQYILI